MKKFLTMMLMLSMLLCLLGVASAEDGGDAGIKVTVSFSKEGNAVVNRKSINVVDADSDGAYTFYDVFVALHETCYSGQDGFAASQSGWVTKFWGVENPSMGYIQNNTVQPYSAMDPVQAGDFVNVFFYQDTLGYSDQCTFFNKVSTSGKVDTPIELKVSGAGYDASWAFAVNGLADTPIKVNGAASEYTTDSEGNVTVTFNEPGTYVLSVSGTNLVPSTCTVIVTAGNDPAPPTGDVTSMLILCMVAALAMAGMIVVVRRRNAL
ncbi:MAG: hypothetical protein MJ064_06780 [Lachnospiraceae bacterium]|nr:hypothetical protein [Lachnospiraceae bacterium]